MQGLEFWLKERLSELWYLKLALINLMQVDDCYWLYINWSAFLPIMLFHLWNGWLLNLQFHFLFKGFIHVNACSLWMESVSMCIVYGLLRCVWPPVYLTCAWFSSVLACECLLPPCWWSFKPKSKTKTLKNQFHFVFFLRSC